MTEEAQQSFCGHEAEKLTVTRMAKQRKKRSLGEFAALPFALGGPTLRLLGELS